MFTRLLVAIDGSPATPVLLDYVTGIAGSGGGDIHVLHVNPVMVNGRGHCERTETEAAQLVEEAVRALRSQLRGGASQVTGTLVRAPWASLPAAVEAAAAARGCDVIVVGSHRRRGLARRFGHGVREQIISASSVPVLVAPAPLALPRRHGPGRRSARPGDAGPLRVPGAGAGAPRPNRSHAPGTGR